MTDFLQPFLDFLDPYVSFLEFVVWELGIPVPGIEDTYIPWVALLLLGAGIFLTVRLSLIQFHRFKHGFEVVSGKYDDPHDTGDITHFQALSTALSATVGIGNIAGVAIAIHWGGPGALFWMWVTAALGMATKFSEVTLSQKYRNVKEPDPTKPWEGMIAGGPMFYIQRGLGEAWKPLAVIFAVFLAAVALFTGNAIQANTVADTLQDEIGLALWISGLITASILGLVIIGGIKRIGRVTAILAPGMATVYVLAALTILVLHIGDLPGAIGMVFVEAFNPSAGVAGAGAGALLLTFSWGVRRGLFSNEAGMGSSPIAHAASKTEEPAQEGMVAMIGPFIDTIVVCTMTAMVIIVTGSWGDGVDTEIDLSSGDVSWVAEQPDGMFAFGQTPPDELEVVDGEQVATGVEEVHMGWHQRSIEELHVDPARTEAFSGVIIPGQDLAVAEDGTEYEVLYGDGPRTGAPLTMLGFQRGLPGEWGQWIVILTVFLFAISTSIAWSYYGDRCAFYLAGERAVLPYKFIFLLFHFIGATLPLLVIWTMGDVLLGLVIVPNLIAVLLLSPKVREEAMSYFKRKPYEARIADKPATGVGRGDD